MESGFCNKNQGIGNPSNNDWGTVTKPQTNSSWSNLSGEEKGNPSKVNWNPSWHDENDTRGHESIVRFDVADSDMDGASDTCFTLTHMNLPTRESARLHKGGWSSSLVKLEHLSDL